METRQIIKRRSRITRQATGKRLELTERDLAIFELLARYRYLRSSYIHALVGGKSLRRLIERLGDLYHEGGYLNRPQQQWQTINARYMPAVYELGDAGAGVLGAQGRPVGRARRHPIRHFQHELMVCDILASIEIGVRADPNLRFVSFAEILAQAPEQTRTSEKPYEIPVTVSYAGPRDGAVHYDRPLAPDALFGIEYCGVHCKDGRPLRRFFALEADRNSEPTRRTSLEQTSFLRKALQYLQIAAAGTYKAHWGLSNLLVLTVTTNLQHMENLVQLVEELSHRKGNTFLLFKTMPSLASLERAPLPTPFILTAPWRRAHHSEFHIDRP